MTGNSRTLTYPSEGFGAPKDRHPAPPDHGLPAGTQVFSADNHISLAEDIFYERPRGMKDQAPRVIQEDGAWTLAMGGKDPPARSSPSCSPSTTRARAPIRATSRRDGRARLRRRPKELAFPNSLLGLWLARPGGPRALLPYLQRVHGGGAGAIGQPHLRRRLDQLVGRRRRTPDGERIERPRAQDLLMPLMPGKHADGKPIDYSSHAMDGVWDAIEEAGVPISHHIGETPPASPTVSMLLASGCSSPWRPSATPLGSTSSVASWIATPD